jgi:hypothetical protein
MTFGDVVAFIRNLFGTAVAYIMICLGLAIVILVGSYIVFVIFCVVGIGIREFILWIAPALKALGNLT